MKGCLALVRGGCIAFQLHVIEEGSSTMQFFKSITNKGKKCM